MYIVLFYSWYLNLQWIWRLEIQFGGKGLIRAWFQCLAPMKKKAFFLFIYFFFKYFHWLLSIFLPSFSLGKAWIWLSLCWGLQRLGSMSKWNNSSASLSNTVQTCWYWPYYKSTPPGTPYAMNSSLLWCQFSLETIPTLPLFCTMHGTGR